MAEILLKVGAGANYEDGDVLCAFNNHRIQSTHAMQLCHHRKFGFNSSGLRPGGLAQEWQELIYQYRFTRSGVEVIRETLETGAIEIFGSPDIDVDQFVRRRLKHANHRIFGQPGAEIWYGGRTNINDTVLTAAWNRINFHTGKNKTDTEYTLWPMGRLDIRHHLAIRTTDFTNAESDAFVAPQHELDGDGDPIEDTEGNFVTLAKRNIKINWVSDLLDDLGVTEAEVRDRNFAVGRDIEIDAGKFRHESKPQPNQNANDRAFDKNRGGPPV